MARPIIPTRQHSVSGAGTPLVQARSDAGQNSYPGPYDSASFDPACTNKVPLLPTVDTRNLGDPKRYDRRGENVWVYKSWLTDGSGEEPTVVVCESKVSALTMIRTTIRGHHESILNNDPSLQKVIAHNTEMSFATVWAMGNDESGGEGCEYNWHDGNDLFVRISLEAVYFLLAPGADDKNQQGAEMISMGLVRDTARTRLAGQYKNRLRTPDYWLAQAQRVGIVGAVCAVPFVITALLFKPDAPTDAFTLLGVLWGLIAGVVHCHSRIDFDFNDDEDTVRAGIIAELQAEIREAEAEAAGEYEDTHA